jgi:Na+-driven multidrug efflux pump
VKGMRLPLVMLIIPVAVGLIYWFLQQQAPEAVTDAAGYVMLIALGAAMAFGFFVIFRGAEDL